MLRTCSCRRAKSLCNSTISLLAAKVKEGQIKSAGNSVLQKVIGSPHERDGWAVPPVADGTGLPGAYQILLPGGEVRAAVLLPARLVVIGTLGTFLAVADGLQLVARYAQLHQEFLGGSGAPVAESQVVLGGTTLVAMALDGDGDIRNAGEDGLERAGILADIALIVFEQGVHDAAGEHLLQGRLSRDGRRRRWRRLGYVNRGRCGFSAAGTGSRERVGSGRSREDPAASGSLHRSDGVIDGNAAGVRHS